MNKPSFEDGPFSNDTVTNTYTNRLRTHLQLSGGWTNGFGYDSTRRLTSVSSPAGTFGYTRFPNSQLLSSISLPNSAYITNTYDSVARLTATCLKNSSDVMTNKHDYIYNVGNQRTQQVVTPFGTTRYVYDNIGQLKVADSTYNPDDRGYTYDAAWNLNYRTNLSPTSFTVNSRNELTVSYSYDDNGNMVTKPDWYYEYDAENRLIWAENDTTVAMSYSYDGKGRLRKKTLYEWDEENVMWVEFEGQGTDYIYDGMRVIQDRGSSTVSYTRGNDLSGSLEGAGGIGGLLARSDGSAHNYYHADGNGNVTYLLASNLTRTAWYHYDPFGNTIYDASSLGDTYRFSSKMADLDTGLIYYGYRWYDPNLQRWVSHDPLGEPGFEVMRHKQPSVLGDGPNRYLHVKNNPILNSDPFGLEEEGGRWSVPCPLWIKLECEIACLAQGYWFSSCTVWIIIWPNAIEFDIICKCSCPRGGRG